MNMRILIAVANQESQVLMRSMIKSTLQLIPFEISTAEVQSEEVLCTRTTASADDVVLLDWDVAEEETPALVRKLIALNPQIRIVVLLPQSLRQYRQQVWIAGACNSIPKEYMDQEWLSSVLCIMHRAMQREERLYQDMLNRASITNFEPEGALHG